MFTKAIVRPPAENFATGLTSVDLGKPYYELARRQHESYCVALESLGLNLIRLEPDARFPDSTFVEDTAVVTRDFAVLARPGAPSRREEVREIAAALQHHFSSVETLSDAATLDGGDICEAGKHFFIGVSSRTNEAGAEDLAKLLDAHGYSSSIIDIRRESGILHLKSGMAFLGEDVLLVTRALSQRTELSGWEQIIVPAADEYAANCVAINGTVLIAAGFPGTEMLLNERGYTTAALEMSEFQKMDGGLSCLSLRF